MLHRIDDTIAAIASPQGGAARGILRLSGSAIFECLDRTFEADEDVNLSTITKPIAIPGSVRFGEVEAVMSCDLFLWPGTRSYTGQPVAEIHTIGSPPLIDGLLRTLCHRGERLAEPGEFTLRAFLSGRIDLTQAEAVLGVIDAVDSRQLGVSLAQLAGGIGGPLNSLRDDLLDTLSHLEAGFDFAEEDLTFITPERLREQIVAASKTILRLAKQMDTRGQTHQVPNVVIVGYPNTGKSSLFNALAGKNAAIVSHHAGTTRDYLTAKINFGELECQLVDTAGVMPELLDSLCDVSNVAQAVTIKQAQSAQIKIVCTDATRPLNTWEKAQLSRDEIVQCIYVLTKVDACKNQIQVSEAISTSSITGLGLDTLRGAIHDAILVTTTNHLDVVVGTAVRCYESLNLAAECLSRASYLVDVQGGEELVAAELRLTLDCLGKVVGAVYTDDVLDRVFSRFCVGK